MDYENGYKDKRLSILNELEDTWEELYRDNQKSKKGSLAALKEEYRMKGIAMAIEIVKYQMVKGRYYRYPLHKYRIRHFRKLHPEYEEEYNWYIKRYHEGYGNKIKKDDLPL